MEKEQINKQNEILDSNIAVIKQTSGNQNLDTKIINKSEKNSFEEINGASEAYLKKTKKRKLSKAIAITLGISFVISLILAWQISIYILIASAILLAILIIYLIALKKNGFECTKIFCCCMDVEDEPQKENSKDNNLSNPRLNKAEKLID